jgi:hypothetical protein
LSPANRDCIQDFFGDKFKALTKKELKLIAIAQFEHLIIVEDLKIFFGIAQLEFSLTVEPLSLFGIA